jgi:ATP-dependent helicase YprA (DUF1998 family)
MARKKPPAPPVPTVPDLHVVPPVVSENRPLSPDREDAFDAKELTFIEATASGESIKRAAELAGFAYTTARRFRRRSDVIEAVRALAREAIQAGTLSLGQGAADAARSLRAIATGDEAAEGPRVSACRSILEIGLKVVELEDVQEQIAEIKEQLAGLAGRQPSIRKMH